MPRVALVYPYFRTKSANELLFPPLGAAGLASQLHVLGIETKIFDCTFDTFEEIQKKLSSYHPDIVGIYSMVTLSRNTFQIAEMVRDLYRRFIRNNIAGHSMLYSVAKSICPSPVFAKII